MAPQFWHGEGVGLAEQELLPMVPEGGGGSNNSKGFGTIGLADKTQRLIANWIDQVLARD